LDNSCSKCKWYRFNENVLDESGKHECYGHSLICSPVCLGYEIEKDNSCDRFEFKRNETEEEIRKEFFVRPFFPDKSTELLKNNNISG